MAERRAWLALAGHAWSNGRVGRVEHLHDMRRVNG